MSTIKIGCEIFLIKDNLKPLTEVPREEAWIFEPKNKHILKAVKEGLTQKGTIQRTFVKTSKK